MFVDGKFGRNANENWSNLLHSNPSVWFFLKSKSTRALRQVMLMTVTDLYISCWWNRDLEDWNVCLSMCRLLNNLVYFVLNQCLGTRTGACISVHEHYTEKIFPYEFHERCCICHWIKCLMKAPVRVPKYCQNSASVIYHFMCRFSCVCSAGCRQLPMVQIGAVRKSSREPRI